MTLNNKGICSHCGADHKQSMDNGTPFCQYCEIHFLRAVSASMNNYNTELLSQLGTITADLKEAEGAVADMMTLNDTLTGEMEALKKCDATGYDRFEAGKSFANRLLKAELDKKQHAIDGIITAYPQLENIIYGYLNHKEG